MQSEQGVSRCLSFLETQHPILSATISTGCLSPYNKWILAVIILAVVVEVVRAFVVARAKNNPFQPSGNDPSLNQTSFPAGDFNQGGAVTAANTRSVVVGGSLTESVVITGDKNVVGQDKA